MKKLPQILCVLLVFILGGCASVNEITPVKRNLFQGDIINSGIAFSSPDGTDQGIAERFPFISGLLKENNLNLYLKDRLESVKKPGCKIITEDLAAENQNAISMVLSIDNEMHKTNGARAEIFVNASIVFFDFRTKSILASYPFMVSYNRNFMGGPRNADIKGMFKEIFSKTPSNINIFDYAAKIIKEIPIYRSYSSTIGVRNVKLSAEAKKSTNEFGLNDEDSKAYIASLFNGSISNTFKIPMIPYSKGGQILYRMAEGYANENKRYNEIDMILKVPNTTYKIDLDLLKLYYMKGKAEDRGFCSYLFLSGIEVSAYNIENKLLYKRRFANPTAAVFREGGRASDKYADADSSYNKNYRDPKKTAQLYFNFIGLFSAKIGEDLKTDSKNKPFVDILGRCQ